MAQPLTLDHVGLVVPDLDIARSGYEDLGFCLTRRSSHKGRLTPDGPIEPWGSGNHCAMFRGGYLEILGVTDPVRHHAHVTARLARYHGLQLVALGCQDADRLQRDLSAREPSVHPVSELGRDVPHGEGTQPGLFRIVHLDDEAFPEAELFFIEHATPDVLWQPALLDHPNGVTGLADITICSADPEETGARLTRFTGVAATARDEWTTIRLARGSLSVGSPDAVASRFPAISLPAVPCVAAVTCTVGDPGRTRACLDERGIGFETTDAGLWVGPEWACGAILEFVS